MSIGTWNITSIQGKEAEIVSEVKRFRLGILGVAETKKKGNGEMQLVEGYNLIYSGVSKEERAREGVGIIVSETLKNHITEWEPINSRIITAKIQIEKEKYTLIQIYAPTEDKGKEERENFYQDLQRTINKVKQRDAHLYIMGDWNGRIGKEDTRGHGTMGKHAGES